MGRIHWPIAELSAATITETGQAIRIAHNYGGKVMAQDGS
jgi:hypothetical protein